MELKKLLSKIRKKIYNLYFLDIHKESYIVLKSILGDIDEEVILEITYIAPSGFYEYGGRRNITYNEYLDNPIKYCNYKYIVTHNLVGEGVGREVFNKVLDSLLKFESRIIIFEHNAYSNDFSSCVDLFTKYLKPEEVTLKFNASKRGYKVAYARGLKDTYRNFFVYG